MSLLSSQTHYGTLTGGCTCDSSLDNNHTQTFACIQVLNLGPQTTQILNLNKVAETPPWRPQAGLLQGPDTGLACLLVIPLPSPPEAHLSLSVSMGTLFFSQVIRGLGSPWIWHWKRATPPSSPTVAWGCTWKSDMAGERKGNVYGEGTLLRCRGDGRGHGGPQACVLEPWSSPGSGGRVSSPEPSWQVQGNSLLGAHQHLPCLLPVGNISP